MTRSVLTRRSFLGRTAPVGAVVLGGPVLLSACGDDNGDGGDGGGAEGQSLLERAREQGFIRVGFANERPYGYADESGNVTGESPEVARAVLAELGIPELDGVVTEFGSLIPGLNAGRMDIVAAGMFITPERCEQVVFSDPDYCAPQALAVQEGNPLGLSDYESVREEGAALGVLSGAVEEGHAEDVGIENVTTFSDPPSMVDALRGGRIDAFALTSITVRALTQDRPELTMTDPFVHTVDGEEELGCGGFLFREENQEFRDEFNRVLNEMQDAGEIAPIVEPFGFGQEEVDLAKDLTAEELCEE
ncbi:MAG: ectoine/hydroxyectoine ABC transporter substrate-binding protein EhuB [Actinomycetota bacterium]